MRPQILPDRIEAWYVTVTTSAVIYSVQRQQHALYFTTNGSCTLKIGKLYFYETKPTYAILNEKLKLGTCSHIWTKCHRLSPSYKTDLHNRKSFCKSYWNWNSFLIHFPCVCKKECFRYDFLNVQKVMDILHVFEKKILWSVSCIQSRKKVPFPTSLKSNKLFLKFKNVDMI